MSWTTISTVSTSWVETGQENDQYAFDADISFDENLPFDAEMTEDILWQEDSTSQTVWAEVT